MSDMTTDAATAAGHLQTAMEHIDAARDSLRDAQRAYAACDPLDEAVYGQVLTQLAIVRFSTEALALIASAYQGDDDK